MRNDIESELEDLAEIKLRASPKKQSQAVDVEGPSTVGPGQYDPHVDLTKKQAPHCGWSVSKTKKDDQMGLPGFSKTL